MLEEYLVDCIFWTFFSLDRTLEKIEHTTLEYLKYKLKNIIAKDTIKTVNGKCYLGTSIYNSYTTLKGLKSQL